MTSTQTVDLLCKFSLWGVICICLKNYLQCLSVCRCTGEKEKYTKRLYYSHLRSLLVRRSGNEGYKSLSPDTRLILNVIPPRLFLDNSLHWKSQGRTVGEIGMRGTLCTLRRLNENITER